MSFRDRSVFESRPARVESTVSRGGQMLEVAAAMIDVLTPNNLGARGQLRLGLGQSDCCSR